MSDSTKTDLALAAVLPALLCVVLVAACYAWVDRPVALFVYTHHHYRWLFQLLSAPSLLPLPFAAIVLGLAVWRRLNFLPAPSRRDLALSLATLAATAAKDELKWIFGRPWPDTWIKYGIYAFHPFDTFWLYGGFPSGHTAYITAPMVVLWRFEPRHRAISAGIVMAVMIGLVGADYHFVSDVIAGFCTGLAAGAGTLVLLGDG
jgi:membrane-associated phospholipid phosphatase